MSDTIINGPTQVTVTDANGVVTPKPRALWKDDDSKKWGHDWKVQNILIFALGIDEFYRISHCETPKAIWDTLQVSHDGMGSNKLELTHLIKSLNSFVGSKGKPLLKLKEILTSY